jgi:hypothetical protein
VGEVVLAAVLVIVQGHAILDVLVDVVIVVISPVAGDVAAVVANFVQILAKADVKQTAKITA